MPAKKSKTSKVDNAVKLRLDRFEQFAVLCENQGFYMKDFELFYNLRHDKNALLKIGETGATYRRFLLYVVKDKTEHQSLIYLDYKWAELYGFESPPENAMMHSSKRVFTRKVKDDDNRNVFNVFSTEEEIMRYWSPELVRNFGGKMNIAPSLRRRFERMFLETGDNDINDVYDMFEDVSSDKVSRNTQSVESQNVTEVAGSTSQAQPQPSVIPAKRPRPVHDDVEEERKTKMARMVSSVSSETSETLSTSNGEASERAPTASGAFADFVHQISLPVRDVDFYTQPLHQYLNQEDGRLYLLNFPRDKFDSFNKFKQSAWLLCHPDKGGNQRMFSLFQKAVEFYKNCQEDEEKKQAYQEVRSQLGSTDTSKLIRKLVEICGL